jgi:hypothetical protein
MKTNAKVLKETQEHEEHTNTLQQTFAIVDD